MFAGNPRDNPGSGMVGQSAPSRETSLSEKERVEPKGPVAAVSVDGFFDKEFQRFYAGNVDFVSRFGGSADDGRAKGFFAVGLDDEHDTGCVGLMKRMNARFAV